MRLERINIKIKLWLFAVFLILMTLLTASNSVLSVEKILFTEKSYLESSELLIFILDKEIDHLNWINRIKDIFVSESDNHDIQTDYTQCNLGRFLYGEESRALAERYPRLSVILEEIKEPHRHLHESAEQIVSLLCEKKFGEARSVYEKKTLPALRSVQGKIKLLADEAGIIRKLAEKTMTATGFRFKKAVEHHHAHCSCFRQSGRFLYYPFRNKACEGSRKRAEQGNGRNAVRLITGFGCESVSG